MKHQTLLRIGALTLVICACGVVYFGALMAMGFRFRDFKRTAK
jgi:putative peptidoglycan lipid II flippase